MPQYKITFDKDACIGVLACVAVAEKLWVECDGNKVDLIGGTLNKETGHYELIIEADDYPQARESEDVCPVQAIKVEKIS